MIFFCSSIYYAFWKTPRCTVDIYIIIRFRRKFNFEIHAPLASLHVKNKEILELKLRTKKQRTIINLCSQKDVKPAVYRKSTVLFNHSIFVRWPTALPFDWISRLKLCCVCRVNNIPFCSTNLRVFMDKLFDFCFKN